MVERIDRVSPIKKIEYDVSQPFSRKDAYGQGRNHQSFRDVLRQTMGRQTARNTGSANVPEAYSLDINHRPTQSLFYMHVPDLRLINGKAHA